MDRDGEATREHGRRSTEIVREEHRFAADTMQQVWDAIEWMRHDPERTLIALVEEAPAITVLTPNVQHEGCGADRRSIPLDAPVGREEE